MSFSREYRAAAALDLLILGNKGFDILVRRSSHGRRVSRRETYDDKCDVYYCQSESDIPLGD